MGKLRFLGKEMALPRHKWVRIMLGGLLIFGGLLGFLPILGFWMLPLGIIVLSADIPAVRRFKRRTLVKWQRWRHSKSS